jgi:hypothetical protein
VVLVAGMRIPEAAPEAVLARVTTELEDAVEQSPQDAKACSWQWSATAMWVLAGRPTCLAACGNVRGSSTSTSASPRALASPASLAGQTGGGTCWATAWPVLVLEAYDGRLTSEAFPRRTGQGASVIAGML